jgi:hypothetical protein
LAGVHVGYKTLPVVLAFEVANQPWARDPFLNEECSGIVRLLRLEDYHIIRISIAHREVYNAQLVIRIA